MARINTPRSHSLPPLMFLHALLVLGLVGLAFAILSGNIVLLAAIVAAPLGLLIFGYGIHNPRFAFLLVGLYACSFMTIGRYLYIDKLSVGVDVLLLYWTAAILIHYYLYPSSINLRRAINPLTLSYMVWMLFTAIEFLNPGTGGEGMERGLRTTITSYFVLYSCTSILTDNQKTLRQALIFGAILTAIAFIKLMIQRYWGFDAAEKYFLYVQGGATTHIIGYGNRYFSIFSDSANFGAFMGTMATIYSIAYFGAPSRRWSIFYIVVALMAVTGILLSGTRSAMVIPAAGMALYCLLCKKVQLFITTAFIGLAAFVFFAFTDIGDDNTFIRRARTAFRPSKDASFNVRVENRKEIAAYLAEHPMGAGINASIAKLWFDEATGTYNEGTLPPDSHYVNVWIQNGQIGIFLYVGMHAFWILTGSFFVLFRVRNRELCMQMAAFTCGIFGLFVSGYANDAITQYPNNIITAVAIAFVMNGPYIDRQLREQRAATSLPNTPQEISAI